MLSFEKLLLTFTFLKTVSLSPVIPSNFGIQNSLSGNSNDQQAALDVRMTIEEVQKMLDMDPKLPRLTRGEIEDLFEQVTKEEYEKSVIAGDYNRAKHMRALMLVLPYNTGNISNDSLQEIYNRPPVTKVVPSSGETKPKREQKIIVPSPGKVEIVSVDNPINPTTYKPDFRKKTTFEQDPIPTTYRPNPEIMKTATTSGPIFWETTTPTVGPQNKPKKPVSNNSRYSSHYNAKKTEFNKEVSNSASKTTSKPKISPELEEILESLGFAAQSQSRKRFKLEEPKEAFSKPVISSLIKQDRISLDEIEPTQVALSIDDFRKPLIPEIKPEDYVAFKPLPISNNQNIKNIHPEIEDYLKLFGIINGERRGRAEKSLKLPEKIPLSTSTTTTTTTTTTSSPVTSSVRPARIKRIDTSIEEIGTSPSASSGEQENIDEEDYEQLKQLLHNIRQLQQLNISLNEDTLNKIDLRNYNFSETLLSQGPDPIENSDSNDPLKNEIKRQSDNTEPTRFSLQLSLDPENESNSSVPAPADVTISETSTRGTPSSSETSSTTTVSTPTTTPTATPSTTRATSTAASIQRADSSGLDDGLDPVTQEPLPPPRKNGFYFLADWNSFLEVGDGDEQVVVRFNPKIGDPSRFIPVTVP